MRKLTCVLVAACASVMLLGAVQAGVLVSEKEVRRQARVMWLSMKRHLTVEPDARVKAYVGCITTQLIAQLDDEHKKLDWEVAVWDDEDTVNASADPNGKISVWNGLLKVADTPDSLAAVLGHEIAHATLDHVMDREKKGARTNMFVLLGSAATGIRQDMISEGATILSVLPYAREQESEADLVGMTYMAKAGFDPRAAIYLWKNMAAANKNNKNRPPEFLSDHPSDDARLDSIVKEITPALVEYNKAREAGKRPNCQLR